MPEDTEVDYANLSTRELAKQTLLAQGKQARRELPPSLLSPLKKLGYELRKAAFPGKAHSHELHRFFGPDVTPDPDDREYFDNPLSFRRHDVFEREGLMIRGLRRRGGETIGEVQTDMRNWTDSIYWSTNGEGDGRIHNGFDGFLVRAYELALPGDRKSARRRSIKELGEFAEEVAYHNLLVNYFANDSSLDEKFIQHPDFKKLREQFIDAHVGSSKASDETMAIAMLAGHFLMKFEGKDPDTSPSQRFINKSSEYHQKIAEFINNAGAGGLPPELTGNRRDDLANLEEATLHAIDKKYFPDGVPEDPKERDTAVNGHLLATETLCRIVSHPDASPVIKPGMKRWEEEQQILRSLYEQFERHKIDLEWLRRIKNKYPDLLITDPEGRRSFIQTVIGNTLMGTAKTADGKVFTASRYLPRSEGYFGADNPNPIPDVIPSNETPTISDICEVVKNIYNGQPGVAGGHEYQSQTQKIYEAAPKILRYLRMTDNVPDEVRAMVELITDKEELAKKITARFGKESDQDINYVNIFFREGGLTDAQKFITYRLVTEFVEGVNTNLILNTQNHARRRGRIWSGEWVNDDFSKLDNDIIQGAITKTLTDGNNQLLLYDHKLPKTEKKKVGKLIANRRMAAEKYLWDSYDTRFIRWVNKRGSYDNALQIAIECVCPLRDTIFNPRTVQQL